jgi:CRISPR-associated protein Cas2
MERQFVVVAYDIPDDKRRTRLHNRLEDFGAPVQYSVFECLVSDKELARLRRMVARTIKPRLDHVRYYFLCRACQQRIETTMGREAAHDPPVLVV